LKAVEVARRSGRSRDILHRLEGGQDVSVSSLLDILRAMNLSLSLVPAGTPTMEEVRERFGDDDGTA
jgi:DNA-binding phage protein